MYDCFKISMIRENLDKSKKSLNIKYTIQNINYVIILFFYYYTLTDKVNEIESSLFEFFQAFTDDAL